MFDSAYIVCKCPNCGQEIERECQTKDTDCSLEVWRTGDLVDPQLKWIKCITNCRCQSGMYYFDLKIMLDPEGRLTNNYKIIEQP